MVGTIQQYIVVLDTGAGRVDVELSGTSADAASRRARWTLIASREYGDIDEVTVVSVSAVEAGTAES